MADAIKEIEIEADGFITREQDLLERVDANRAKPVTDCPYPNCERCDKYHGHYCTVPMVVSKQIWRLTEALIVQMENRLTELENLVTDEILGSGSGVYVATQEEYENFSPAQKYWYDKSIANALHDVEFVEGMKNLKPSINDKPVEIRTSTPIKRQYDPDNMTWDDYLGAEK